MNDFLTRLVSSSFADAPAIRPRLPSRFEAAGGKLSGGLETSVDISMPAENISPVTPASVPVPNQLINVPAHGTPTEKIRAVQPTENNFPSDFSPTPASKPAPVDPPVFKTSKASSPSAIRPAPRLPAAGKIIETRPASRQNYFDAPQAEPASNPPPAINVTIGRVEVRAIQEPAPKQKPAKPAAPKLSLENYLQPRNGGDR